MKGTTFYLIPGTEICPGWIVEADRCGSELFVEVYGEAARGIAK